MVDRLKKPAGRAFVSPPPPVIASPVAVGATGSTTGSTGKSQWIPPRPPGGQASPSGRSVEAPPWLTRPPPGSGSSSASAPSSGSVPRPSSGSVPRPVVAQRPSPSGVHSAPPVERRASDPSFAPKSEAPASPAVSEPTASAAMSEPPAEASSAEERVSLLGLQNELAHLDALLADVLED